MNKSIMKVLICLLTVCLLFVIGCSNAKNGEEYTFSLEKRIVDVSMGETAYIPTAAIVGEDGKYNEYTVSVYAPSTKQLEIDGWSFVAEEVGEYKIVYAISQGQTWEFKIKCTELLPVAVSEYQDEVECGAVVEIPTATVEGEHASTVSIFDDKGNSVVPLNNTFVASLIGKYTIIYEFKDEGKVVARKTIEITSVDQELPIISVDYRINPATMGEWYSLPNCMVSDNDQIDYERSSTIIYDANNAVVSSEKIKNNKLLIESASYKIVYTYYDVAGNVAAKQVEISVIPSASEKVCITSFNSSEQISLISASNNKRLFGNNPYSKINITYGDACAKISFKNGWCGVSVQSTNNQKISGEGYFLFKIKCDSPLSISAFGVTDTGAELAKVAIGYNPDSGEWQDVYIKDTFFGQANGNFLGCEIGVRTLSNTDGAVLSISEIYYIANSTNYLKSVTEEGKLADFSDTAWSVKILPVPNGTQNFGNTEWHKPVINIANGMALVNFIKGYTAVNVDFVENIQFTTNSKLVLKMKYTDDYSKIVIRINGTQTAKRLTEINGVRFIEENDDFCTVTLSAEYLEITKDTQISGITVGCWEMEEVDGVCSETLLIDYIEVKNGSQN